MSDRSQDIALRPESLLPLVRAAMSRGEGPPAVLSWMRSQGQGRVAMAWTSGDEDRARDLARPVRPHFMPVEMFDHRRHPDGAKHHRLAEGVYFQVANGQFAQSDGQAQKLGVFLGPATSQCQRKRSLCHGGTQLKGL